jgi:hypothetical protein
MSEFRRRRGIQIKMEASLAITGSEVSTPLTAEELCRT